MRADVADWSVCAPRCLTGRVCGDRVLPSIANEVLKSVVAQYNAIELIGKREQVHFYRLGFGVQDRGFGTGVRESAGTAAWRGKRLAHEHMGVKGRRKR